MMELFWMGGPLFMGLITIAFFAGLAAGVYAYITISKGQLSNEQIAKRIDNVKSLGLLALVIGVLGQMIGLFEAFKAIEQMGSVSPAMLAGGLKVSSITTLWGLTSYAICSIFTLVLRFLAPMQAS